MKKLRHREGKSIAQGLTTGKWWAGSRGHSLCLYAVLPNTGFQKMLDKTLNYDGDDDDANYGNHLLSLCALSYYCRLFSHIFSFNLHNLGA